MTSAVIVRRASVAGVDLGVIDGQLVASSAKGRPEDDLLATLQAHKASIIVTLEAFATIPALCVETLVSCLSLTLSDLTAAERVEAEILAADLIEAGELGQFVIDLMHAWGDLTERERLQAAWCWDPAVDKSADSAVA